MAKKGELSRKSEFYIRSTNEINNLHVIVWEPENEPVAILQISHGMVEYIDRYDEFANYLTQRGILVVGNDHLGHGKSVNSKEEHGYFAKKDASKIVVDDLHMLTEKMQQDYPSIPYFVLGHSMGSFMIRRYTMTYGSDVDGVIIMGTGDQPKALVLAGKAVSSIIKLFRGEKHRSKLLDFMAFGSYNKRFKPTNTTKDWLSKDTAIVDKYCKDPYCTFIFTVNGFKTLFSTLSFIGDKKNIAAIPKNLPLFFVAGEEDPVGEYGKAVTRVYETYKSHGVKDIAIKLYKGDRHEILNETDRETVYEDIYTWLKNHMVEKR